MPYKKRKQKCTQSDGDKGNYVLSYTTKKGEKRSACHTSKKNMQGQIAAIEAEADMSEEEVIEEELRKLVQSILSEGEETAGVPSNKVRMNDLMRWSDFESTVSLKPRSGVGPGEDRLAEILGGEVQGQSESFDLSISDGPMKGRWEVKAPDNSSEIRPGTEGITAFGPINKTLRNALDELTEFLSYPGVDKLAKEAGVTADFEKLVDFTQREVTKSGKTNVDLISSGEITAKRFEQIMSAFESASKLVRRMQGDLLNIQVGEKEYEVTPTNMLKISRLLGIDDSEASEGLGAAADAAIALSSLNNKVFKNPQVLRDQWKDTVDADEVFDLEGVILVTPDGFMMIPKPYGESISFSRVTQGKPKFKTPLKGKSGDVWESVALSPEQALIREAVHQSLLSEDLTGSDKSEIKRMIKKELEGSTNRKEIDKAFKKNFDKELRKALGASFFGTPGKINKFVIDEIQKEVEKNMGSSANREVVVRICKDVLVKLYRELSFSYKPVIDRMKV